MPNRCLPQMGKTPPSTSSVVAAGLQVGPPGALAAAGRTFAADRSPHVGGEHLQRAAPRGARDLDEQPVRARRSWGAPARCVLAPAAAEEDDRPRVGKVFFPRTRSPMAGGAGADVAGRALERADLGWVLGQRPTPGRSSGATAADGAQSAASTGNNRRRTTGTDKLDLFDVLAAPSV